MKLRNKKSEKLYEIVDISGADLVVIEGVDKKGQFVKRRINPKLLESHYELVEDNYVGQSASVLDIVEEVIFESSGQEPPTNKNTVRIDFSEPKPKKKKASNKKAQVKKEKAPVKKEVQKKEPTAKKKTETKKKPLPASDKDLYTLQDFSEEVGMTPASIRAKLRKLKIEKPGSSWQWSSREEASHIIKRFKK